VSRFKRVISPAKLRIVGARARRSVTLEGVIWHIYRTQEKGMIRGDDGV
jgi:hypothetical protein